MTWSAKATVESAVKQDVYPDSYDFFAEEDKADRPKPVPIVRVQANAKGDDITSNTEGKLTNIHVVFTIDGAKSKLKVGDVINISGHFGYYEES